MTEVLTAAQMRAIEAAAIESGAVNGLELMERAGRGVVEAVFEEWPHLAQAPHHAVVLCGPGNNGGDGFVIARLLKDWGWGVEVFLYGDAEKLPPDARVNYERWTERGDVGAVRDAPRYAHQADLFVDALFGTGLGRALDGDVLGWVADHVSDPDAAAKTVAVDIPSGLCSDSGRELKAGTETVLAGLTVSFHAFKLGHVLGLGPVKCGKSVVKSIGIEGGPRPEGLDDLVRLVGAPGHDLDKHSAHKFAHGHALILSGGPGHTGAARLAARGALRIGAGLVTLGVPPAAQQEAAAQLTAIMLRRIGEAPALGTVLEDERINALCLGPALGLGDEKPALIAEALKSGRPMVVDADALTLIAADPTLFALFHEKCVLTPHAGEFARLFPDIASKLKEPASKGPAYSKVDATRDAAARTGCTVLFKGPDTVIASPDGRYALNSSAYNRAAPWLATAGAGDVLAGFITGLLARGFTPQQAAETGAWLHTECALGFGPGLIAEDLSEALPEVLRKLLA